MFLVLIGGCFRLTSNWTGRFTKGGIVNMLCHRYIYEYTGLSSIIDDVIL